jgi:type VI secretion system protein ImpH
MASARRGAPTPLSGELFREPFRFDFFQAVRLVERIAGEETPETTEENGAVGADARPDSEAVRFRAASSLTFSAAEIARLSPGGEDADGRRVPAEMDVNFLGLTGPAGVLPRHYTSLMIERSHPRHKDYAMRAFFDLFNHRAVSFFYRAWEKYRFPIGYERARRGDREAGRGIDDLFTFCLYGLVGLGTAGLRRRFNFPDDVVIYYGAHFARRPPCAVSLQAIVADFLRVPAEIRQHQGQWLYLSLEDQSSFPSKDRGEGRNLELGVTAVAGSKVWDIQSKFRVRLGPLMFAEFSQFLPNAARFRSLCQVTRLYVGPELDFDVQLLLKAAEVPWCRLGSDGPDGARLGWNTWIRSDDFEEDVDDAVFAAVGF